ncbi:MAG: RNA polymerase Rpb4 family protein [archaeon]
MLNEKVLSVKPIPLAKVKELLKDLSKENELTYEQGLTLKYVEKFSRIPRTKAEKLMEDLLKFDGMNEELAIKITDLLPQNEEVLALIMPKTAKVSDEDTAKILKLVKSYFTAESKTVSHKKDSKESKSKK